MTEGKRLERFVRARWGRPEGGIRALADVLGTSADTVYRWFRGETPPDVYYLGKLAAVLEVKRWEIVAAMDGEEAALDPLAVRIARLEAMVDGLVQAASARGGSPSEEAPPSRRQRAG